MMESRAPDDSKMPKTLTHGLIQLYSTHFAVQAWLLCEEERVSLAYIWAVSFQFPSSDF